MALCGKSWSTDDYNELTVAHGTIPHIQLYTICFMFIVCMWFFCGLLLVNDLAWRLVIQHQTLWQLNQFSSGSIYLPPCGTQHKSQLADCIESFGLCLMVKLIGRLRWYGRALLDNCWGNEKNVAILGALCCSKSLDLNL